MSGTDICEFVHVSSAKIGTWLSKAQRGTAVTMREHNSVVAALAEILDVMARPALVIGHDSPGDVMFPQQRYNGKDTPWAGSSVPVLGLLCPPEGQWRTAAPELASYDGARRSYYFACAGLLRMMEHYDLIQTTPPKTSGALFNTTGASPAFDGVVGVGGRARRAILTESAGDPDQTFLHEKPEVLGRGPVLLAAGNAFEQRVIAYQTSGHLSTPAAIETQAGVSDLVLEMASEGQSSDLASRARLMAITAVATAVVVLPAGFALGLRVLEAARLCAPHSYLPSHPMG
jgi:hypothetical protein